MIAKTIRSKAGMLLVLACFLSVHAWKFEIRSLKKNVALAAVDKTQDPRTVYRFFDEDFVSGGYAYWYPDNSKVFIPEQSGKNGEVALQFDLEAGDYSGGSVCLYNLLYDIRPYYASGALQFWIKGNAGSEIAWVALVDDENADGKKTVVRLPLQNYGGITNQWSRISVPLVDFGKRGVFWDAKKRVEVPEPFEWQSVAEFRIEIKKTDNPQFRVWVDDIFVLRDVFAPKKDADQEYWDERKETITPPVIASRPPVKDLHVVFEDDYPPGGFTYLYGGKSAQVVQQTSDLANKAVLACYLDNEDYSGVTVALGSGNNINMEPLRKSKAAGLAFWAKAGVGVKTVYIGLLDDESDGAKVQTKVVLGDFGSVDTTWKYFMIPLRQFQDRGIYWDEAKKAEVADDVKWNQISEIRFSINKGENRITEGEPVSFYVDHLSVIEEIPGYVDPEEYWAAFSSDAQNNMLHDFETNADEGWESAKGPKSLVGFEYVKSTAPDGGKNALSINFKMNDWCDVIFNYSERNRPAAHRDWSKHWGLKFDMYTTKPYQPINVQINDSGDEIFVASAGGQKGWNEVLVPFKSFYKFPYWQPPEAVQNGKFDLENVIKIDFKPSGEGTSGVFVIDNVRLTNERDVRKTPVAENVKIRVDGSFEKVVTQSINGGIFGINAALWDSDLLKPKTIEMVKAVNHRVIRYPGGLRADEDHWKEVLAKKEWMIDVDEFLDFCTQTNATPMFTVNFGRGTPQEAAEWVKHVNITKKAGVRYWEIGNELYGDWHPNFCTAEEYGKRSADFIKAMKAVDPSILVTVVWVLEGEWNKIVFEHTKDFADGVNVHHYPQHAGEENDAGLLSAPQSLDELIPAVRRQIENCGSPGRPYQLWLTEWNSVDFKPGPQTLTMVNALFVADYLGMLAKHNIEQASYWDIHNDITAQGGDYGYLSRTGAPDGDNAPRPSYWAFRLASDALRGILVESATGDDAVRSYLTVHDGKKQLLLINKYPETKALVTLAIPGFQGKASIKQLKPEGAAKGFTEEQVDSKNSGTLSLPPYSITLISIAE